MKLSKEDLRDMIRKEIELVMKSKQQTESNPYHGMKGTPDGGQFTSSDKDGSWAIGKKQFKYRGGKKAGKSSPCGRVDTIRKRTCSKGVIKDSSRASNKS